ncbi:MAG TPA: endolytic transglycosylase MltG [Thermoanaerobaculia bacterium]|nr:endolytic transglycosylase MltG [Thermoanaerobaculia bacterium]
MSARTRKPSGSRKPRRGRWLWGCVLLLVLVAAGTAAAAGMWALRQADKPYKGFAGEEQIVVVEPGTPASRILEQLEEAGVIADARLALGWMRLKMADASLQAGEYRFTGEATLREVLEKLARGDVMEHSVTVVEGLDMEETAAALAAAGLGEEEAFLVAMRDPSPIADLDPEADTLEGYLFPSTYNFTRNTTEREVVETMVRTFRERWETEILPLLEATEPPLPTEAGAETPAAAGVDAPTQGEPDDAEPVADGGQQATNAPSEVDGGEDEEGAAAGAGADRQARDTAPGAGQTGRQAPATGQDADADEAASTNAEEEDGEPRRRWTVREVVALASLVEKEARMPDERALIASVYANRLDLGMGLYADPTVIYALKLAGRWDGNIRREDLRIDSPYNTYRYRGLPPGPIASPGLASLKAAANPAETPYLYFVSRNDGTHVFARTLAEHNRNVERWQRRYWQERRAEERREAASGTEGEPDSAPAPDPGN